MSNHGFSFFVSGECSFRILVVVWKCLILIYSLTFHNQDFISVIWKWIVWCTGTHLFNVYAIWQIHFQFISMCINQIIWFIFEYFFQVFFHHSYVNCCLVFALYFLHHDCLFFFIFIFSIRAMELNKMREGKNANCLTNDVESIK